MRSTPELTPTEQQLISAGGWYDLVLIGSVLCGLSNFRFTCGLCVDIQLDGISSQARRYCFESQAEAKASLDEYIDTSTHPTGNWIKCKGITPNGEIIDVLNPNLV